ncbi:MAG: hypothetical protein LBO06_07835 [Bacteroidales bacterium]|jgi:glucose-1-phosphate thymidylyltransferase|nr:hypothetical protein [Bacteroidales bacterium]
MNIIIPMAGMGKRMRPHTLTTPKPLIKIAGKPIVQRLCEEIAMVCGSDIDQIGFVIGDFGKEVEQSLIEIAQKLGAKGEIYYQREALGTAHAIMCAEPILHGNVIVAFADTLFEADFKLDTNQDCTIWTQEVENPSAFGVVKKNDDGTIHSFVEKPKTFVSNEAIIGIYYFNDGDKLKSELSYIIDNGIKTLGEFQLTDALQNMLDKKVRLTTSNVKQWLDCGNKNATVMTNSKILELKAKSESLISDDVVKQNSVIIEPCFVGKGVRLVNSVIGPYVSLEEGVEVKDSVVANSMVGSKTMIENAVINNSMLGCCAKFKGAKNDLSLGDYNEVNL